MKISLIAPSRGRPEKCIENLLQWLGKSSTPVNVVLSLDNNDKELPTYKKLFPSLSEFGEDVLKLIHADNTSVVEATNIACKHAIGDILIYVSDDFDCPENWDELILKEFEGCTRPLLVKVDDCLQPFDVAVLTIPIMNRALYERLGYFFHPEYKSMYTDEDLYWTVRKLGALKFAEHLKFTHEHVSVGKAQDDETYRRSARNWDQGKAVFAKRKALGFPV